MEFHRKLGTRVCCEAVRSAILATAWLLVFWCGHAEERDKREHASDADNGKLVLRWWITILDATPP